MGLGETNTVILYSETILLNVETIILTREDVKKLASLDDLINLQISSFKSLSIGNVHSIPSNWLTIDRHSGKIKVMAGYLWEKDGESVAIKTGSNFEKNTTDYGLPNSYSIIVLMDPNTSYPLALIEGMYITGLRTGAAVGVATKFLSRHNSKVIALIGSGLLATHSLIAIKRLVPTIELARVYSRTAENREKFASVMKSKIGIAVEAVDSVEKAIKDADVITTCTRSETPILTNTLVVSGVHINAVGSKKEIDPAIFRRAKIIVDDRESSKTDGKISIAIRNHFVDESNIHCSLGDILLGKRIGRSSDDEITLFDCSGTIVQDASAAMFLYRRAKESGVGTKIDLYR